ncbi:MAG TPA: hypothetical protein VHX43_04745 [Xanthobacteraceae bacterium]|jgi:hypothetical protein|nr:hypothetical protein [Xanthobacteraceae bacterium]
MRRFDSHGRNASMDENHQHGPSRYFFIVRWPDHDDEDADGTLFLSKSAALAYARRIVGELKEAGGYDGLGLTMVVEDDSGKVVDSIPF